MFLFVALLMVLLSRLLPIGVAMMVLAVIVLLGLALGRRRPGTASAEDRPVAEPMAEPAAEPVIEAVAGADRELVGAHRS